MRRTVAAALAVLPILLAGTPARAGVYSSDLGKCMVAKTSAADKNALIRWIFIAISSTPAIADLTRITPQQQTDNAKVVGTLLGRLLTVDCRKETVLAIKYDGQSAIESSFGILGEASMGELMSGPSVLAGLAAPSRYLDDRALEDVFREAGVKPPASPTT